MNESAIIRLYVLVFLKQTIYYTMFLSTDLLHLYKIYIYGNYSSGKGKAVPLQV